MDLGLYGLKYPVRTMISGLLPRLANTDPNHITLAILPVGIAMAACAYAGAHDRPWLWLALVPLGFLRMFLATLDGLVATHFGKSSPAGEIVNRAIPELCDVGLFAALALARPEWRVPGVAALSLGWLTTFAGMVGAVVGKPTQSVGPVGQTDRLAALMLFAFVAFLGARFGWPADVWRVFLWWCALGGILTVVLRMRRHFAALRSAA